MAFRMVWSVRSEHCTGDPAAAAAAGLAELLKAAKGMLISDAVFSSAPKKLGYIILISWEVWYVNIIGKLMSVPESRSRLISSILFDPW